MTRADARRLQAFQARLQQLTAELATSSDFVSSGSVVRRYMRCGKPNCRCHGDPPQLHGPYWQWTRAVNGKTVTRRLTEDRARLYQRWIANRRRLTRILAEMETVSERGAAILLRQPRISGPRPAEQPNGTLAPSARRPAMRVTRQLAEALTQASQLLNPAADAARQWLDARDGGDRALIAQTRGGLEAALAESTELLPGVERVLTHVRVAQTVAAAAGPVQAP